MGHPGKPGMPRFCPVCTGPEILSIPDAVKGLEEPSSPHVVPPELLMQPQSEIVYDAGYKRFTLLKSHVDSTRWKAKQHHTYPKLPRLGSVLLTKVLNSKWKNKYVQLFIPQLHKWSTVTAKGMRCHTKDAEIRKFQGTFHLRSYNVSSEQLNPSVISILVEVKW